MTTDVTSPRSGFVASQVSALGPLDFLVVGVPVSPFDAIQVLREEDGSLAVAVSARPDAAPFTAEQIAALTGLGFGPVAEGGDSHEATVAPADAEAAAAVVDAVLTQVLAVGTTTPVDIRHGSERAARAAEAKLADMRRCIEPVLEGLLGRPAPQDEDGDYLVDVGHVRVFVAPRNLPGRPPPIIRVFAITNAGVNLTPDLGLFLSRMNFSLTFGRFSIDADNAAVWFDETLLGDHVTPEELRFTVEMVATTANEWDQKIAATFGGRTRPPESLPSGSDGGSANKPGQGGYL